MFDVIRPLVIGRLASPRFMWEHDASFAVQSMHEGLFACARRHSRHCVKALPFDGCVEGSGWSVPGSRESHFLPRRRSARQPSDPWWPVGGVCARVERAGREAESMGRGIAGPGPFVSAAALWGGSRHLSYRVPARTWLRLGCVRCYVLAPSASSCAASGRGS